MRQTRVWAGIACGAAGWIVLTPAGASAAERCDEYNPFGPARVGEITLNSADFADEDGTEMRSFIETESVGKVEVEIVRAKPAGAVRDVSAAPEVSTISPYFGERLKGIRVAVSLTRSRRPVSVVLKLRQVCARHFRNTFLYY